MGLRTQAGAEQALDVGSSGRASDDALALAFRCEAAGDTEAMVSHFGILFVGSLGRENGPLFSCTMPLKSIEVGLRR